MDVRVRICNSVVLLDLQGQMTIDADTDRLQELCAALSQLGIGKIVLNMKQVPILDCSGIGQMVSLYRQLQEKDGQLKLTGLSRQLTTILDCAGLLTVIESFDNEADAVASFGEGCPGDGETYPHPRGKTVTAHFPLARRNATREISGRAQEVAVVKPFIKR